MMAAYTYKPSTPMSPLYNSIHGWDGSSPFIPNFASMYPTPPWKYRTGNTPDSSEDEFTGDVHFLSNHRNTAVIPPVVTPSSSILVPLPPQNPQLQECQQPTWAIYSGPTWYCFPAWQTHPPTVCIHPLLDGEFRQPNVMFDLSSSSFYPLHLSDQHPLTLGELNQHATQPPITKMRITCDLIPRWPIKVPDDSVDSSKSPWGRHAPLRASPFLTVYDVLVAIYHSLNQRTSRADWELLSASRSMEVSSAYSRRCRRSGTSTTFVDGTKRVDFLSKQVYFKGLVGNGGRLDRMKLIVGREMTVKGNGR